MFIEIVTVSGEPRLLALDKITCIESGVSAFDDAAITLVYGDFFTYPSVFELEHEVDFEPSHIMVDEPYNSFVRRLTTIVKIGRVIQ